MFRKPKKKPSALRGSSSGPSSNSNVAGDGTTSSSINMNNDAHDGASKKRPRRARRNSSSSSEEEDNDKEEGTSDLLQQIRQERDTSAKSKKSSAGASLLNTSSTSISSKKKNKGDNVNNWMHQYKSNDKAQMSAQDEATRTGEYHPNTETDKQSSSTDNNNNNTASSQNAQISALQKQPRNKFLAGPLRATTFVRTTVRFDYQPDVCKDYKETGFCGFGDTCIYLHDRGDTKTGWQMEQEYEEKKKRDEDKKSKEMEAFMNSMMCGEVKQGGGGGAAGAQFQLSGNDAKSNGANNSAPLDDGIPFACHLCRGPFKDPIVTTCSHYFCEKCMQTRVREVGSGCPICQKDTHGVLNHAQKLVAKKRRLVGRDGTWEEYLERSQGGGGDDGGDDA
mmetsp:Transcript_3501/g.7731  ORF Transcript_3501/g.7731 Transcript_3501/m.7731 type:complete len:393 (+) Transcript_3501:81-1259(+)|eukprot:CAMPEP_0172314386 /NCGR_PEP_ID=MMETSP1058-20130122/22401_1 /TAXON_ID=83371 /ORGANISM="Detonula confervacea, Strain CCMP 353" /LENGTH=392 /DNA_ID=CAMNT_0013028241 /DNA_START=26 /DNA_END=1204 /DNA_ORIENTATION=-